MQTWVRNSVPLGKGPQNWNLIQDLGSLEFNPETESVELNNECIFFSIILSHFQSWNLSSYSFFLNKTFSYVW